MLNKYINKANVLLMSAFMFSKSTFKAQVKQYSSKLQTM